MQFIDPERLVADIATAPVQRRCGRVQAADGATLKIGGLSAEARLGDRVHVAPSLRDSGVGGEVVSLEGADAIVMTDGRSDGVALGDNVWLAPEEPLRPCEAWLGRVLDAFGAPVDGRPLPQGASPTSTHRAPPPAFMRGGLGKRISTGLAPTDTLLPIARGQRVGVFAGSGVGKSLLLSSLARNMEADVVVFALIGERGRELGEFIADGLGPEGMKRAVVVVATSDESALKRRRAAWTAMAVAEHFRDTGKHVLLLIDSITRFAEAHREVALTAGETPSLRAYPPSTSNMIAALAERAGPAGRRGADGAITGVFSVLVAGSDMEEPVADITRGVLDGHIVLSREIAERGRFPAIDVGRSVSRSLPKIASQHENGLIADARRALGLYEKAEPMVRTGLHQTGLDEATDRAIRLHEPLEAFFAAPSPNGPAGAFQALQAILKETEA